MMPIIRRVIEKTAHCLEILCSVIFFSICFIVLLQVIARFILKVPTPWSEELARYLLVVLVFLGASISIKEKTHLIALNVFQGRSEKAQKIGRLLTDGIVFIVSVVFARNSVRMSVIAGTEMASSMIWLKTSYLYDAISIGFILSCLFSACLIFETLLGQKGEN